MSQVTLTVGNRKYTVACAAGEEERVASLGAEVDGKLDQLGGNLAPQEAQNLLFAALLLADELRETKLSLESERKSAAQHKTESDDSVAAATRDLTVAQSQRDSLTQKVKDLETELDGLQSAQQNMHSEADDLRKQLEQRAEEAAEQCELAEKFAGSAAELERERDALKSALDEAGKARETAESRLFDARKEIATSAGLLAELNKTGEQLATELSAAKEAAANLPAAGLTDDPNLAPALERFAEMLENCATKLEGSATNA